LAGTGYARRVALCNGSLDTALEQLGQGHRIRPGVEATPTFCGLLRIISRALWLSSLLSIPLTLGLACLILPESLRPYRATEAWLLWALQCGGVCTIKLGQWASTRPDLLPRSICASLGHLHSTAPTHPVEETQRQLALAFGNKGAAYIVQLNPQPIGSGAIAQVHEALSNDGQQLAIKVVHPGVEVNVSVDLWLLKMAARLVESFTPLHGMQWLALPEAVDHFSEFMHQQLDLRTEAYNLTRFIANFPDAASSSGSIVFPRPIEGFVTKHVLVETLLPGKPISCLLGRDGPTDGLTGSLDKKAEIDTRKRIARRGLHAFLKMVLVDNFVHADLHPGNILVDTCAQTDDVLMRPKLGPSEPLVGFVDAGLVVELSARDQRNFVLLFHAIAQGDGERAADLMLENAPQQACADAARFREGMRELLSRARFGPDGAFNLSTLHIGDVLAEVTTLVRLNHVKIDPTFTTLVMAIGVLEGLGRQLDPQLDLFSVAIPLLVKSPYVRLIAQDLPNR